MVGHVMEVSDANFAREVTNNAIPTLVDFWAAWCGPCRAIGPMVEELAEKYQGKVCIAKLNVDENPHTAMTFAVQSIPTLILFKGGKEVDRIIGAVPKGNIETALGKVL